MQEIYDLLACCICSTKSAALATPRHAAATEVCGFKFAPASVKSLLVWIACIADEFADIEALFAGFLLGLPWGAAAPMGSTSHGEKLPVLSVGAYSQLPKKSLCNKLRLHLEDCISLEYRSAHVALIMDSWHLHVWLHVSSMLIV